MMMCGARGAGTVMSRSLLIALAMLGGVHSAHAHGIAGNRFFPGTLSFDDPAVADEAILPNFASFKSPVDGGNVVDDRFDWSFFRLLTPTLGVGVDSAWVHRNWGNALRSGFDVTSLGLKGEVYRNDLHPASSQRSPETKIDDSPDSLRRRPPYCFSVASWSLRTRRHGVICDFEWTFVHFCPCLPSMQIMTRPLARFAPSA